MTEDDLFPRRFTLPVGGFVVDIKPRWAPDVPRGPDHPQSWGTTPHWVADITVDGVLFTHPELRHAHGLKKPLIRGGVTVSPANALVILGHYRDVMAELYQAWRQERDDENQAESLVDKLLDEVSSPLVPKLGRWSAALNSVAQEKGRVEITLGNVVYTGSERAVRRLLYFYYDNPNASYANEGDEWIFILKV